MDLKLSVNEIVAGLKDRIEHVAKTYLERVTSEIEAIAADARGVQDFGDLAHRWGKVITVRESHGYDAQRTVQSVDVRIRADNGGALFTSNDGGVVHEYEDQAAKPCVEPGQYLLIVELRKI
jgi:hypothetical protein